MEAVPAELTNVDAEFAAAIAYPLTEHQALAELTIGEPQAILLLGKYFDLTLQTLLDAQVGMLEVVAQHRLDQRGRMRPQAEKTQIGQQALPIELGGGPDLFTAQSDQGKQLFGQ